MSSHSATVDAQLPTTETGLTADELFGVITTARRRNVLSVLSRHEGSVTLASLASTLEAGDSGQWSTPSVTLHHLVLPELERTNLVNRDGDAVVLTDGGESVAAWLDAVEAS
ncbi:hypothetical protein [Salinigranum sp.]|uniref:DUF7344 domain-containing protein n=1 Tax=Salinigranum sp. TaxID=1966351 RepID=UPI00356327AD